MAAQPPGIPAMGAVDGPAGPMPEEQEEPLSADSVTVEQVFELLHNDKLRGYRIDIETDSTIVADEQADKESWNEMLTAVGGFMAQSLPIGQAVPEFVPVLGEILQATVRKYRAGKGLEDSLDTAVNSLIKKTKTMQNQPPPPDPAALKAKSDIQVSETKAASDIKISESKASHEARVNDQKFRENEIILGQKKDQHAQAMAHNQAEHDQRTGHANESHFQTTNHNNEKHSQNAAMTAAKAGEAAQGGNGDKAVSGGHDIAAAGKEIADALGRSISEATDKIVTEIKKPTKLIIDPKTGRATGSQKE